MKDNNGQNSSNNENQNGKNDSNDKKKKMPNEPMTKKSQEVDPDRNKDRQSGNQRKFPEQEDRA